MRPLLVHLKPYGAAAAATLLLVLVQVLAELGLPTLMAGIIDGGVSRHDLGAVAAGGAAMLVLSLLSAAAAIGAAWTSSRLGAGFARDLRNDVFRKATILSADQFSRWGPAGLITRTTNDVVQVQSFVVLSLRLVASAPLMAAGGLVMAFLLDPGLALVLLVAVPVLGLAIVLVARRAVVYFGQMQQNIDRLNLVFRESLSGVRVIRAFDRGGFDAGRFGKANTDLADISLKTQKLMAVVLPGMMLAMSLSSIALVWFGGVRVESGLLSVGELLAFVQYSAMILFSLMMMSMLFVILPRAAVSAARIGEVLTVLDEQPPETEPPPREGPAEIEFRNVTFRYPGAEKAALENVSFRVPAGTTTALIGGTGSGKTTVLLLAARFHDATSGQVLVDGTDVRRWPRAALRGRLGLSFQKTRLFKGSIADNLRWGDPEASDDAVRQALETSQSDFAASEKGAEAVVDAGGTNLSGGQRQRLAVARALIRRPAALLLDDSFSALDFTTDAALRAALKSTPATVLLSAQRLATVRNADQIVVLDEGRLAGAGTHKALLAGCAVYREIAESQEEAP